MRPPTQRFRQSRHNVVFLGCLGLVNIMMLVPISVMLQCYSPNCGPYGPPEFDNFYDGIRIWHAVRHW
jgi:hypothetical protein